MINGKEFLGSIKKGVDSFAPSNSTKMGLGKKTKKTFGSAKQVTTKPVSGLDYTNPRKF
jgi:hypothetical protein